MRKLAIAVALLLGLAAAATPLVGGLLARERHAVLVESLGTVESATLGLVRIVDEDFALGWLRSSARTRVEIGPPGRSWSFTLLHRIHHGPVPIGHIARAPLLSVIETIEETGRLRGETVIDLEGDLGIDLRSQPLPRREDLAWEGASARIRVEDRGRRIAAQLSAPRLELRRGGSDELLVESAKADYASDRSPDGRATGSARYAVARARIGARSEGTEMSVDGLSWTSSTGAGAAGRVNITGDFGLKALQLEARRYQNVAFRVELRDLDAAALATLDALRMRAVQSLFDGQPVQRLADLLASELRTRLPTLVSSPARVDVSAAHVETPDGSIDLDLRMRFDGVAATRPLEILQLRGHLTVPLPVFGRLVQELAATVAPGALQASDAETLSYIAQGLADQLLRQRYVAEESDGRLSADLVYERGQIALDGIPLDLGALFGQATQDQVH